MPLQHNEHFGMISSCFTPLYNFFTSSCSQKYNILCFSSLYCYSRSIFSCCPWPLNALSKNCPIIFPLNGFSQHLHVILASEFAILNNSEKHIFTWIIFLFLSLRLFLKDRVSGVNFDAKVVSEDLCQSVLSDWAHLWVFSLPWLPCRTSKQWEPLNSQQKHHLGNKIG